MAEKAIIPTQAPADTRAEADRRDSGRPGGGQGRTDVTGIVPQGVHVDPDLTEGHPGYQESGDSEVIPNDQLAGGKAAGKSG